MAALLTLKPRSIFCHKQPYTPNFFGEGGEKNTSRKSPHFEKLL